jgi:hypothetical protein
MDKKKQMQQIPMITPFIIVANQTETPDATWTAADCIVTELVTETRLPTELTLEFRYRWRWRE